MKGVAGLTLDFDLGGAVGILRGGLACSRTVRMLTLLEVISHFQAQISRIRRVGQSGFVIDDPRADELVYLAVEVLHAFGAAIAHGIEKRLAFAFTFFNVLPRAHRGLEDFHGSNAPLAVLPRKQALGNNAAEGFGEPGAN